MIRTHRTIGHPLIRTALPSEATAIAELHTRARATYYPDGLPQDGLDWPARWRSAIERPDAHVLCAIRDGRLVGIASFRTEEDAPADTVTLFQFHVDPDHWRAASARTSTRPAWNSGGPTGSGPPPSTCTSTMSAPRSSTPARAGPVTGSPWRTSTM